MTFIILLGSPIFSKLVRQLTIGGIEWTGTESVKLMSWRISMFSRLLLSIMKCIHLKFWPTIMGILLRWRTCINCWMTFAFISDPIWTAGWNRPGESWGSGKIRRLSFQKNGKLLQCNCRVRVSANHYGRLIWALMWSRSIRTTVMSFFGIMNGSSSGYPRKKCGKEEDSPWRFCMKRSTSPASRALSVYRGLDTYFCSDTYIIFLWLQLRVRYCQHPPITS